MRRIVTAVLLPALFLAGTAFANEWQDYARRDLEFIHATIRDNHPGSADIQNPWFKRYLRSGYSRAVKDIPLVRNHTDYKALLRRYTAGFKDVHISMVFRPYTGYTIWPGFIVEYQGDEYKVMDTGPDPAVPSVLPQKGWTLLSCDGIPPSDIMKQQVFRFEPAKTNIPAEWIVRSRDLLLYASNVWKPLYRECIFSNGESSVSLPLVYRDVTLESLQEKTAYKRNQVELSEPDKETVWISLPSFALAGAEADKMRDIISSMPKYRKARTIVFDLRGNGGGSSVWGNELLDSLYGSAYMDRLRLGTAGQKPVYAEFRASAANLDYLKTELIPTVKKDYGSGSVFLKQFSDSAESMAAAVEGGLPFSRKGNGAAAVAADNAAQPLASPRVLFITDGKCISSCLSFLDVATKLPRVALAGQPTGADTCYTELRKKQLPSDMGTLVFAIAVYRNRARDSDFYYNPQYRWTQSIDDPAVRGWIFKSVIPALR